MTAGPGSRDGRTRHDAAAPNPPGPPTDHGLLVLETCFGSPLAQVLSLRGTVGISDERELEAAFARAAAPGHPVIVDLGALYFGDEALLGLLLDLRGSRHTLLVGPLSPSFERRLARTGTRDLFTVHPSLTSAQASLAP
ncbi:hypothetical protein EES43_27740 [Streptomyces sp. ADI96-02]|uniref:STAS domain-containing protein n=1 Tax=unclassified Streptomyces TaxID=2593676 RepID=UPI000F559ACF|nr:STAS domain-containing protein [Streptomyces sp. ADI96-02]RPK54862.1 hypothetical protein EES43_27740 [Streptomyces sp. ADI96-02]